MNKYLGDDSKDQGSIQFDDEDAGFADAEEELDKIFEDLNLDERIVLSEIFANSLNYIRVFVLDPLLDLAKAMQ